MSGKVNRNGQAKVLTPEELELLFTKGLTTLRDRVLFSICINTACRIAEACQLKYSYVYTDAGEVRDYVTFGKNTTKGKIATRQIPINESLKLRLQEYYPTALDNLSHNNEYLFSCRHRHLGKHIHPQSADLILRNACKAVGLEGVSTHSFRRTAITHMNSKGTSLVAMQAISGHRSLTNLVRYVEVSEKQKVDAAGVLDFGI